MVAARSHDGAEDANTVHLIAADGSAKWFILSDNGATHNITKDVSNLLPSTVRSSSAGPSASAKSLPMQQASTGRRSSRRRVEDQNFPNRAA